MYVAYRICPRRIQSNEFFCNRNARTSLWRSSFEHAGGIECKFACVSGSYALYDNTNWIRAEENNGKAAIVIVSDIAKYDIGSSGEYTQGAGAVAILIKENPRLLAFDKKLLLQLSRMNMTSIGHVERRLLLSTETILIYYI